MLGSGIGNNQRDRVVQAQISVRVIEAGRVRAVADVQIAIAAAMSEMDDDGIDGLSVKTVIVPLVVVDVATDQLAGEQIASHYKIHHQFQTNK